MTQPRDKAIYDARLASALLAGNNVEEACEVAADALTIAERLRVPRITESITGLAGELQRHRGNAAADAIIERAAELRRYTVLPGATPST